MERVKPERKTWLKAIFVIIMFAWMATYPIYTNYFRGKAILQYDRHHEFLAGESIFFNPWQYRVLSPLLVEGIYQLCDHTVFKLIDLSALASTDFIEGPEDVQPKKSEVARKVKIIQYNLVFVGFRFLQNLLILYLSFQYLSLFVRNKTFVFFTLMFISLIMGNAVVDSDLSFNVYTDIILFLWAGIAIFRSFNYWWIFLITILGALNRETSALIMLMFFFSKTRWEDLPNVVKVFLSDRKAFLVTLLSGIFFVSIFAAIRMHYGYRSPDEWHIPTGWPMLKMNLFSQQSIKSYMELFAVFGLMPIWCLLIFKEMNFFLRVFFVVIIPVWFFINFWYGIVSESRIFLVPTLLVFLPAVMEYIDRKWQVSGQ